MITDFPTAPLAPGLRGAGGSTVEKSLSASHTEILTLPREVSYAFRYTSSYFTVRHKRSTKTLSRQQPLPSMLIRIPWALSTPVNSALVN